MVNWGFKQDDDLILAIERGDIDPHNLDGNYLFGKTVQLFPGYEGDGSAKQRANVIARLRKKLRNYLFDGTISGRRKRRAVGELFTLCLFSTGSPRSYFLSSPLAHVSEFVSDDGDDEDDKDKDDDNNNDDSKESGMDVDMHAKKAVSAKKPSASKPDPTAAITSTLGTVSLQSQPKCVRYNLSIDFPVLVSPTGYFRDGQRRICVDFLGIGMHFENNYKVETSGKTLKLFMRIPRRFVDPSRVDAELAHITHDRDTIVSSQRETASMVYQQYGDDGNIWSSPQVVALPFEVETVSFFKPIWSDGCEDLYSQLNRESENNGGTFPNNAVHQLFLILRVILVSSDKARQGSNKMADQFNISPTRR